MRNIIICFYCFCHALAFAQEIPSNPNVTDSLGQRQGKWTIAMDKDFRLTKNSESTLYYRIIEYKDDKPIGITRDYYRSGKVKFESSLIADRPNKIVDGVATYYREDGTKEKVLIYKSGVESNAFFYRPDGSESEWAHLIWLGEKAQEPDSAFFYFSKALGQAESEFGKSDLNYANTLNKVAICYSAKGSLQRAQSCYLESIKIVEKVKGKESEEYIEAANNISMTALQLGDYAQSSLMLSEAVTYQEKISEKDDPVIFMLLRNLADSYSKWDFKKAEAIYVKGLQLSTGRHAMWKDFFLQGLGNLYFKSGRLLKAEDTFKETLSIQEKRFGKQGILYAFKLKDLASIHERMGKFQLAESEMQEALKIIENDSKWKNYYSARYLGNLAMLNFKLGDFSKGELFLLKHQAVNNLSTRDDEYYAYMESMGTALCEHRLYPKAEPYFQEINHNRLKRIRDYFPWLSEFEKDAFYKSIRSDFDKFNAYSLLRTQQSPNILGEMYNNQLVTKALLLNSLLKWKQRIRGSGDQELISLFTEWEKNQQELAKLYMESVARKQGIIDSLEKRNAVLEKDLSRRSESFVSLADKKEKKWEDIKARLKPNEVAIELIRVRTFGTNYITDSSDVKLPRYPMYGLTDTIYYAALLVTPTSVSPELVLLKNGNDLENKYIKYYRNCVINQITDTESYNQFWKPIADRLKKLYKKRSKGLNIYFSSDGVFNQLNLNTLYNPVTRKYLIDEVILRPVTNTKDLLAANEKETLSSLAYLFGYPNYDVTTEVRSRLVQKERDIQPMYYSLNIERGNSDLNELPGTKTEVETIGVLMTNEGWQPKVFTGDMALEETLKDCFKPRVLHIATHGYFQADISNNQNPLLRSGLMLTGASQTLKGDKDDSTEDGILTAYEAMNLNLDHADLVVLSACETGLGEVRNGEGVYGLQRAFKVAGAKAIIMSLWKVDDDATQELMTTFYSNWLSTQNKRLAFNLAQQKLKTKYKSPYYWGAFLMIGE